MYRIQRTLLVLFAITFSALVARSASGQEATPVSTTTTVPQSTTTSTTTPPTTTTTTTTLPDLSGVDFVQMARDAYGKCGEWHDLAISVGWPEEEWSTLSAIIWRESRCDASAWNGADAGLTQINRIHTEWLNSMGFSHPDDMFNPEKNLYFAYRLWDASGWRPWRFSGTIPE